MKPGAKSEETTNRSRVPVPWATGLVTVLALVVALVPRANETLIYQRALILHGEWWRAVTGNWVHFGGSHLFWNLAVFLPAGIWLERIAPRRARLFYALAPLVVGLSLLAFDPLLLRYAGLSGVVAGVLALLAFTQLSLRPVDRWFWWAVLGLLFAKITVEIFVKQPVFAHFAEGGVHAVPLAHLAGVLCASAFHFRRRRLPI